MFDGRSFCLESGQLVRVNSPGGAHDSARGQQGKVSMDSRHLFPIYLEPRAKEVPDFCRGGR